MFFGEMLVYQVMNFFPILLLICLLYGALNHVILILHFLFLFLLRLLLPSVGLKVRVNLCPAFCRASWYCGFALLKIIWLLDMFDRRV